MLTAAQLQAYYTPEPAASLPEQGTSPFDPQYKFGGTVKNWQAGQATALYYGQNTHPAGQLSPGGSITFEKPVLELATPASPLRQEMAQGYAQPDRPLDTLNISLDLKLRSVYLSLGYLKPVATAQSAGPSADPSSGAPLSSTFGTLRLDHLDVLYLVWAPDPLTLQGELRCLSGSDSVNLPGPPLIFQTNSVMNIKLQRGWNALKRSSAPLGTSAKGVHVTQNTWTALPLNDLTQWAAVDGPY